MLVKTSESDRLAIRTMLVEGGFHKVEETRALRDKGQRNAVPLYPSVSLFVSLQLPLPPPSPSVSLRPSIPPSFNPYISLSLYLSISLSLYPSTPLSICRSIPLSLPISAILARLQVCHLRALSLGSAARHAQEVTAGAHGLSRSRLCRATGTPAWLNA